MKPAMRALACAALLSSVAPNLHAQAEDQAMARALFDEGRKLMKAGQFATACPKLEAARKLYSSAGILLNLADCYEKVGRTASAWSEFGEAASVAARSGRPDDADEARRRQGTLEPALNRLSIRVSHAAPGLVVKRDGVPLSAAAWGSMLPVDPGAHEITAEAEGYETWTSSVSMSKPGQTGAVEVPALRALPPAGAIAPSPSSSETAAVAGRAPEASGPADRTAVNVTTGSGGSGSRVVPWVLIGGGAAITAGALALMFVESGKASTARDQHDPAAFDAAQTPWTIGLVGAIAGGLGLASGAVLLATSHGSGSREAARLSPWIGASGGGVRVGGSF
jgi:tetratricopeptide (TPR) repeat protein